jgi:hypothetical protein
MSSRWYGILLLANLISATGWSHANLVARRAGENIKIDQAGPGAVCGANAGTVPAGNTFQAGTNVVIQAVETIHHPSHYFVSMSTVPNPANQAAMVPVTIVSAVETTVANANMNLTVANATLKALNASRPAITGDTLAEHNNQQVSTVRLAVTVQIPAGITCNPTCTLQFLQQMEENVNTPTYYKSCLDFQITTAPTPTPTPTPTPDPNATPTPTPVPTATPAPQASGCH